MPPVLYRGAALWLAVAATFACKPRSDGSSALRAASETATPTKVQFDYNLWLQSLKGLAGHLGDQGCAEAAQWLVAPKDNDFPAAIAAINGSNRVYEATVANLLDPHWAFLACRGKEWPKARTDGAGIKALAEAVKAKGYVLTVLVIDGVGSLFTPSGPIAEARAEWEKTKPAGLTVEHVSFDNLTNLETAKNKLKDDWQTLANKDDKRRFLIWAPDVAGNLALDLLAANKKLRDKTLALVTIGSPLGGMVKSMFAERLKDQLGKVSGAVTSIASAGLSTTFGKFTAAMKGMASLTPEARRDYLNSHVKNADFSREDEGFGPKTRVFFVASVIDPANLTPFPLVGIREHQLAAVMTTRSMEQSILLPFLASLKDEPLGDGLVSLPNAVIPPEFVPSSLTANLLAITTFDAFALQMTRRADEPAEFAPPYAKIVDSLIEGLAIHFGGFAGSSASSSAATGNDDEPGSSSDHALGSGKTCAKAKRPAGLGDQWVCVAPCKWVCKSCEAEGPEPEQACN